ncbi:MULTISPECIES: ATP-grasp domain-containing protein [Bacillus]|uniref:ATP-grasp domain-containing protein n=1 Tax=Bacillus cereus VD048 TaxID=1053226 RepID=J8IG13_BACCE|nr:MULTISPECIES: ATP-grasp domain-containing protein [Bacillus]EJR36426.1 hypothetical protein IIG_01409 [Bacillus cereus VD048]MBK5428848.1 ATP-grasp domain-containing protein [Bacillus sp. TH30]WJE33083.1 ATP-grasp domain-containing protein [Bacillus mycoides]WOA61780.1 ATP-grasp domain-containing protein [Bacillus mycoides]
MEKKLLFVEANTTGTGMLAIRKAKELGYEPIFLTQKKSLYHGLSDLECRVIELDTNSVDAIKHYIIHEKIEDIAGILTTSDYYLETVAELVQMFRLSGNTHQAIYYCRNKAMFREKLHLEKVLQPKFHIVQSIDSLQNIYSSIQFPCVVKPADDSGSNNVRLCSNWEEVEKIATKILANKYNARGQEKANMVLLEEYIEGPEYSVEMFSWEGNSICIGITEKQLTGFPYFVESGHIFPVELPKDVQSEIEQTVKCALQAVDFRFGASHSEVKWTSNGCVVIEVNARLAGGMIPELVRHSTGVDLLRQQVLSSVGVAPEWKEIEYMNYAGIHFLTAKKSGFLSTVKGIEEVRELSYIEELVVKAQVGQPVNPPENFSHRLGHVMVRGRTYEETVLFLEEVAKKLEIQVNN